MQEQATTELFGVILADEIDDTQNKAVEITVPAGPLGIALHAKAGGGALIMGALDSGYLDVIDAAVLEGSSVLEVNGIPCSSTDQQLIAELFAELQDKPRVLRVLPVQKPGTPSKQQQPFGRGGSDGMVLPMQDLESRLEKPTPELGVGWFIDPFTGSGSCGPKTTVV
jgi:hypothetical protein